MQYKKIERIRDMAQIYSGILDLVGRTPLVEAVNLEKKWNLKAKLLLKLEYFNPAGSVKDRVAKEMLEDAENNRERALELVKSLTDKYPLND